MTTNSNYIKLGERSNSDTMAKSTKLKWCNWEISCYYSLQDTKFRLFWPNSRLQKNWVYKMTVMSREMERKHKKYKRSATLSWDYQWHGMTALLWEHSPYGSVQFLTCKVLWRINCIKFSMEWWQCKLLKVC